ncbi:MipA/OmpV family protein [Pseudoalteromonas sp. HL-AS2]|uniref:MipA/OmpV family protein n=1 Tax=Pseudoalteromonas sp. HL-AS2 TaxID=3071082 RepID=UPI002742327C|nr:MULTISPECIES: MipA/OmpV family protein [unclassified Pseudoalteromonas]WMS94303.1 MipA/OmpV family protein [Pseudoalteromonas sp. HL-AS2]
MQQPLPILLSTLLVTTSAAYADSPWSVAGGVIAVDSPYANTDTKVMALPMINYQGEKLTLRGYTLDYTLLQQHGFSWSATLAPGQFFDSSDSDNPAIKALNERKMSLYAGTKVSYAANFGRLNASVTHDILGHSDGLKFNGDYNYPVKLTKELMLAPFVGVEINSSQLSNYYYGVAEGESSTFDAYELSSTVNYNIGLLATYKINKNLNVNALVKYHQLDADIEDSPIIDTDNLTTAMMSITYHF